MSISADLPAVLELQKDYSANRTDKMVERER